MPRRRSHRSPRVPQQPLRIQSGAQASWQAFAECQDWGWGVACSAPEKHGVLRRSFPPPRPPLPRRENGRGAGSSQRSSEPNVLYLAVCGCTGNTCALPARPHARSPLGSSPAPWCADLPLYRPQHFHHPELPATLVVASPSPARHTQGGQKVWWHTLFRHAF